MSRSLIDLFKELWGDATFFWKMVEILSQGILSKCKDQHCNRFRRDIAVNFASNLRLVGVNIKERTQVPVYLL